MSKQDEIAAAIERAFQAELMTKEVGWEIVRAFVEKELANRQHALITGAAKSMDQYNELVGWIAGASFVLNAPDELEAIATRMRGT